MTHEQIVAAFGIKSVTLLKAICMTQNSKVYPESYTRIFFNEATDLLELTEKDGSKVFIDFVDINSISFYSATRPAGETLEGIVISP